MAEYTPVVEDDLKDAEIVQPDDFTKNIHLNLPDSPHAPTFLVEGVACQSIVDVNLSMQALAQWTPGEDITQLQSAQATCRVAAMAIKDFLDVALAPKLEDSRHSNFRRMNKILAKRLTEWEPCDPEVDDPNDYRVTGSIKLICKYLQYGNTILDVKASSADRREAMKMFLAEVG